MLCAGLAVQKHSSCPEYTSYSPAGRKHSQAAYSLTPRVYVIGITIVTIVVRIVIIMVVIIVVIVINSNSLGVPGWGSWGSELLGTSKTVMGMGVGIM